MFDILAYLVERYLAVGIFPDGELLSRQLCAAGFEPDQVDRALAWLSDLEHLGREPGPVQQGRSTRLFAAEEASRLDTQTRGYLMFLESAGVLDAAQRELAIERILAIDGEVTLEQAKLVVLVVLWSRGKPLESLIVDELLTGAREQRAH